MTKWLTLVVVAGSLLGCAEPPTHEIDESPEVESSAQTPASPELLQFQAGGGRITNISANCTSNSDCKGSAPSCLTSVPLVNTPIVGGACTALCTADNQCGANAGCPLAQVANLAKTFAPDAGATAAQLAVCLPKCKTNADCRADLPCQTIPIPSIPFLLTAPTSKFCLPPLPTADGGVITLPDGGTITIPTDGGFRLPDGGVLSIPGFGN